MIFLRKTSPSRRCLRSDFSEFAPSAVAWSEEAEPRLSGPFRERKSRMNAFQIECVATFTRAALAFSLPASVGQIYGLLFATLEPLSLDEICDLLKSSRGGTFQSMKWLREVGMIERVRVLGLRKGHFRAVLNLRQLATNLLRRRVEPHVRNGADHLERLRSSISSSGNSVSAFQRARYEQMERWHGFLADMLPLITGMAEKV